MSPVADFAPNTAGGRDLVDVDVHGCFATLEAALANLAYDPERDRMFSLGDLIDYGTRSPDALEWMQSRFTATVRGNHEDMMHDWLVLGSRMWNEGRAWRQHWASAWCPGVAEPEPALRDAWLPVLEALAYSPASAARGGHLRSAGQTGRCATLTAGFAGPRTRGGVRGPAPAARRTGPSTLVPRHRLACLKVPRARQLHSGDESSPGSDTTWASKKSFRSDPR